MSCNTDSEIAIIATNEEFNDFIGYEIQNDSGKKIDFNPAVD
jgi:hypothetical protein